MWQVLLVGWLLTTLGVWALLYAHGEQQARGA